MNLDDFLGYIMDEAGRIAEVLAYDERLGTSADPEELGRLLREVALLVEGLARLARWPDDGPT